MNRREIGSCRNREQGFSLMELMFAVAVLAIAVVGALAMIVIGIGRNGNNRMDTAATNVAQTVLEQIAGVPAATAPAGVPVLNNPVLTITDCTGANLPINTAPGGPVPDPNTGDIDWTAAPVAGYQMNYTVCNNGRRIVYDVRWYIQQVPNGWAKMITIAARPPLSVQKGTQYYVPPVTLRTVVV